MGILGYVCTQFPETKLGIILVPLFTFSAGAVSISWFKLFAVLSKHNIDKCESMTVSDCLSIIQSSFYYHISDSAHHDNLLIGTPRFDESKTIWIALWIIMIFWFWIKISDLNVTNTSLMVKKKSKHSSAIKVLPKQLGNYVVALNYTIFTLLIFYFFFSGNQIYCRFRFTRCFIRMEVFRSRCTSRWRCLWNVSVNQH